MVLHFSYLVLLTLIYMEKGFSEKCRLSKIDLHLLKKVREGFIQKKKFKFSKPWSGPCPPPPLKVQKDHQNLFFFSNDLKIFSAEENKQKGSKLAKKELRSIGMMVDRLNGPQT